MNQNTIRKFDQWLEDTIQQEYSTQLQIQGAVKALEAVRTKLDQLDVEEYEEALASDCEGFYEEECGVECGGDQLTPTVPPSPAQREGSAEAEPDPRKGAAADDYSDAIYQP